MSNTYIQIKRSSTTSSPATLKDGELAYSYLSNTLFLGTSSGSGVINVGGLLYTQTIDSATNLSTASTLVKRDTNGAFYGTIYGNANTATTLQNGRNFSISGGDITADTQGFDGSASVVLNASLNNVPGLTAGSVGSSTSIPVIGYGANGRILTVSSASISSSFTVSGNTGSGTQNNGGTLTFQGAGGSGINTTVTGSSGNETVTFNTDNTIVRSNTSGGAQTIGTDVNISGNLAVSGAVTYVNTAISQTNESLLHLAANNTVGDVIDIGFVGDYNNGTANVSSGLVRDAGSKNYYLFQGVAAGSVTGNTIANNLFTTANTATLNALLVVPGTASFTTTANVTNDLAVGNNLFSANGVVASKGVYSSGTFAGTYTDGIVVDYTNTQGRISVGSSDGIGFYAGGVATTPLMNLSSSGVITTATWQGNTVGVPYGGTGQTSFTSGQIIVGNGSGGLGQIANVSTSVTGGLSTGNTITSFTTDSYGRVTAYTGSAISGLTVGQGGTGQSSFTSGQIIVGNGTGGLGQIANVSTTVTGALSTGNTITSITTDAWGRLTAYTGSAISGLTVGQGGTGASIFTQYGIMFGNGSGALQATAQAGTSDQTYTNQILTVTNAGIPTWASSLDGGSF